MLVHYVKSLDTLKNLEIAWTLNCPLMHKVGACDKLMPKELQGLRSQPCSYSSHTAVVWNV